MTVYGRSVVDRSLTMTNKRVYFDVWYDKNWSLWYDLIILFKTVRVVIARRVAS